MVVSINLDRLVFDQDEREDEKVEDVNRESLQGIHRLTTSGGQVRSMVSTDLAQFSLRFDVNTSDNQDSNGTNLAPFPFSFDVDYCYCLTTRLPAHEVCGFSTADLTPSNVYAPTSKMAIHSGNAGTWKKVPNGSP